MKHIFKAVVSGVLLSTQMAQAYVVDQFKCHVQPVNDITPINDISAELSVVRLPFSDSMGENGETQSATNGSAQIEFIGGNDNGILVLSTYFELNTDSSGKQTAAQHLCISGGYTSGAISSLLGCKMDLKLAEVREGIPVLNPSLLHSVVIDHQNGHAVKFSCDYIRTLNNPKR